MTETIFMTTLGHQKIQDELEKLIKIDRENIKKAISEARELGDLKENAEYHAAKERQAIIEGRIMELQGRLANANVIDISKVHSKTVVFGATVTLLDIEKDKTVTYQIVGKDEADIKEGKISYDSPIAKSLLGKSEGDTVIVKAPKGNIEYEIQEFFFQ